MQGPPPPPPPTRPQTPGVPQPPQVSPAVGQPPQSSEPPQPLPMTPQYLPPVCWQTSGVQVPAVGAQTPARPPAPQVWPLGQLPQFRVPPQPSPMVPQ